MTHLGSPLDAYDFIEQIGDGSFGTVHKAKNKKSQKFVAVKVMKKKYSTFEECEGEFEPKMLQLIPPHANIVQIFDSFLSPTNCNLSFIMEYMDGGNLYQLMREKKHQRLPFSHQEIRSIMHQTLSAVSHIHQHNVFHRDMKPENLLLDYSAPSPVVKLADFGLARELSSKPPYEEYVSTRWYRAPEVLLRSTDYSAPVDLWAVGTIFAELINLEPLFPGESEIDQIYRICHVLGSPGNRIVAPQQRNIQKRSGDKRLSPGFARKRTKNLCHPELSILNTNTASTNATLNVHDGGGEWKEGVKLAYKMGFLFPSEDPKPLRLVLPSATDAMLDLIKHFLCFNPSSRWTAEHALRHPFFTLETEEHPHTVVQHDTLVEPITPPDDGETGQKSRLTTPIGILSTFRETITPDSLLSAPQSPYQICPDWSHYHDESDYRPVSRNGRPIAPPSTAMYTTHTDSILKGHRHPDNGNKDAWLIHNRPIYSSHEKKHPAAKDCIKYNYASKLHHEQYQQRQKRISETRKQDNSSGSEKRRAALLQRPADESHGDYTSTLTYSTRNKDHSVHRLETHNTAQHDCLSHYSPQFLRWTAPHFIKHPRYTVDSEFKEHDRILRRPESRRLNKRYFSISTSTEDDARITTTDRFATYRDKKPTRYIWPMPSSSISNHASTLHHQVTSLTPAYNTQHTYKIWLPLNRTDEESKQTEEDSQDHASANLSKRYSPAYSHHYRLLLKQLQQSSGWMPVL